MIQWVLSGVYRVSGEMGSYSPYPICGDAIIVQVADRFVGAMHMAEQSSEAKTYDVYESRFLGEALELRGRLEPPFDLPLVRLRGEYAPKDLVTHQISGWEWRPLEGTLTSEGSLPIFRIELHGEKGRSGSLVLSPWIQLGDVTQNPLWSDFFRYQLSVSNPWQLLVDYASLQTPLKRFLAASTASLSVFIMMRFRETPENRAIRTCIRNTLNKHKLIAQFADDLAVADTLWDNVCCYMLGCSFGIAVVEEIEERSFNPNVALELGFMLAIQKPVLVLKDKRVPNLPTDLVGRLYREFDSYNLEVTVEAVIDGWIEELRTLGLLSVGQ